MLLFLSFLNIAKDVRLMTINAKLMVITFAPCNEQVISHPSKLNLLSNYWFIHFILHNNYSHF